MKKRGCLYMVTVGPVVPGPDPDLLPGTKALLTAIRLKLPRRPEIIFLGKGRRHRETLWGLAFFDDAQIHKIPVPGLGLAEFVGKEDGKLYCADGNLPEDDLARRAGIGAWQGFKWMASDVIAGLLSDRHKDQTIVAIMDPNALLAATRKSDLVLWPDQLPSIRMDVVHRIGRDERGRQLGVEVVRDQHTDWNVQ